MALQNESAIRTTLLQAVMKPLQDETMQPLWFLDKIVPDMEGLHDIGGTQYRHYLKIKVGKAGGLGMRGSDGTLPSHTNPSYTEIYFDLARFYATADIDRMIRHIKDANRVVDTVVQSAKDIRDGIRYQLNAQFLGDDTAAIARIASTHTASATVTCADDGRFPGTRRLRTSVGIDSYNDAVGYGTDTIGATALTVSSVASRTTFVASASVATADASDYIYWTNSSGTYIDAIPMGITAIVDGPLSSDGATYTYLEDLFAGDASAYPMWRAYVSDNGGTNRYLDSELIEDANFQRELNANVKAGKGDVLLSQGEILLRFRKDEGRDHDWVNKTRITAGVKVVDAMVNGEVIPWVTDPMVGKGTLFCLRASDLVYKGTPMEVLDSEGWKRVENKDAMRMQVGQYAGLGCKRRCSHFVIRDLGE